MKGKLALGEWMNSDQSREAHIGVIRGRLLQGLTPYSVMYMQAVVLRLYMPRRNTTALCCTFHMMFVLIMVRG